MLNQTYRAHLYSIVPNITVTLVPHAPTTLIATLESRRSHDTKTCNGSCTRGALQLALPVCVARRRSSDCDAHSFSGMNSKFSHCCPPEDDDANIGSQRCVLYIVDSIYLS